MILQTWNFTATESSDYYILPFLLVCFVFESGHVAKDDPQLYFPNTKMAGVQGHTRLLQVLGLEP